MAKQDIIAAVGALSRIAEIKQFGLATDYSNLLQIKHVVEINDDIKREIGIDLLNSNRIINAELISKYEERLERIVGNNLSEKLTNQFLADEIELLSNAKLFPLNSFRALKIEIVSDTAKAILKPLGIITPSVIAIAKSAIKVEAIDKKQENFLALSNISIKSKKLLILFHIHIGNQAISKRRPESVRNIFENAVKNAAKGNLRRESIAIASCFLVSLDNPNLNEDSLVHLFIQGLLKYGVNTTIGNQTRKFFLKGVISSLMLDFADEVHIDDPLSENMSGTMEVTKTQTGYEYRFVYNISIQAMLRNYKKGIYM